MTAIDTEALASLVFRREHEESRPNSTIGFNYALFEHFVEFITLQKALSKTGSAWMQMN